MTLYTLQVPDPAPGEDWTTVVPGLRIYDVTGITATLETASLPVTTIFDASNNGNDGTYLQDVPPFGPVFVPGLVDGNDAVDAQRLPSSGSVFIEGPSVIGWDASWTLTWWEQTPVIVGSSTFYKYVGAMAPAAPDIIIFQQTGTGLDYLEVTGNTPWRTAPGTIPNDGAPRMLAVQFDHNTGTLECYLNGTLVPWDVTGTAPATSTPPSGTFQLGNGGLYSANVLDELAIFRTAFLPIFFALLYGDQADFAAYSNLILTSGPRLYYHFAPNPTATGATPGLQITNGSSVVALIGDGFAAQTTPGPYAYSWQPKQQSNARGNDGILTTVGIPQLILPGGYTIGTRTPDMAPADQWSNIVVWWSDDYEQAVDPARQYDYGRGAHLVYRQIGT